MRLHPLCIAVAASLSTASALGQAHFAQQGPQDLLLPRFRGTVPLAVQPTTPATPPSAGGARVTVASVRIEGLTRLNDRAIAASLGDLAGQQFDMSGLATLAMQVQDQVRAAGLSFARAYVPPQNMAGGVLRIVVVEGQYGQVQATGSAAPQAQPWLAKLQPGQPIEQAPMERALMLLQQLPGVQVQATLSPGSEPGSGDLQVQAQATREVHGEVGIDNHGSPNSGSERVRASLEINSPFTFGDQLSLSTHYTRLGTWLGSASYSLPLGTNGLRANLSASRNSYELGEEFASLKAHGTSDTFSAGLSYPLLLKLGTSISLSAGVQHRNLRDQYDAVEVDQRKRTQSLPVTLSADHRDAHGLTWGNLALTVGRLRLDGAQQAQDDATARTAGRFTKVNLDVARLQDLAPDWTLYGRVSAQWASKNLDPSEKFLLGGPNGVRAWPVGEALGDDGMLARFELRRRLGPAEPYVFFDAGHVRINHTPWTDDPNRRSLSGAGLGMRSNFRDWLLESSIAWRAGNTASTTEPDANSPQVWVSMGRQF